MKSHVAQARGLKPEHNLEGLNRPIKVHVEDGVFIMPHTGIWSCYLVPDKELPIVTWIGLNLIDCCARRCPLLDSWLHSHCAALRCKGEKCRAAANGEFTVREIVKHVAFRGMRLAPGKFMGADIGGFAKVARAWIPPWGQVSHVYQDPV